MPRCSAAPRLPVPRHWQRSIRSALIHVIALAHYALACACGRAGRSSKQHLRQTAKTDQHRPSQWPSRARRGLWNLHSLTAFWLATSHSIRPAFFIVRSCNGVPSGAKADGNGTGDPNPSSSPDFFNVRVDAVTLIAHKLSNQSIAQQEYAPPPGVELAFRENLGFSTGTFWFDSAYNMGLDPRFDYR